MGQQCMLNQNEHVHAHHMWCVTQTAVILLPGRYFSFDSISVCYVGKISLIPLDVKALTYSPSQASLVIRGINTCWDEQIHRMRGKSVSHARDEGRNGHWVGLNFKPCQHEAWRIEFKGAECSVALAKGVEKVAGIDDSLGAACALRRRCKHSTSLIVFLGQ